MTDNLPAPAKAQIVTGGQVAALVPRSLEEAYRLADAMSRSGMTPNTIKSPEAVLVAIMAGAELGMAPFQSLQSFAVISGKPALWGDAIPALLLARGFKIREWFDNAAPEYPDNMVARCEITRPDGDVIEGEFSVADAKEGLLWTKSGPWQTSRKRMLKMRARAFAARDGAADVLRGLYVADEVQDYQPGAVESDTRQGTGMVERLKSRPTEVDAAGFNVRQIAADTEAAHPKGRQKKAEPAAEPEAAHDAQTGEIIDGHFTEAEPARGGAGEAAQAEVKPEATDAAAEAETPASDDLAATLGGDDLPASLKGEDDGFPGDKPVEGQQETVSLATALGMDEQQGQTLAPSDDVQEGVAGPGEVYFLAADRELDAAGKRATFKDGAPFSRSTPKDEIMVYDDHAPAQGQGPIFDFLMALHTFPTWDAEKAAIAALYKTDEWNEAEPKEQAAVFLAAWTRAAELKVDPGADAPAFRVWVMTSTDDEAITGTYAYLKKQPAFIAMVSSNPAVEAKLDAIVAARRAAIKGRR